MNHPVGMSYDFFTTGPERGHGEQVVRTMTEQYLGLGHTMFMDSCFFQHLADLHIYWITRHVRHELEQKRAVHRADRQNS